jgi:hypothetical protein
MISMANEKELLESVERGEWRPARDGKPERSRLHNYASGRLKEA